MASVTALREYGGSSSEDDSEENSSFDESLRAPLDTNGLIGQNLAVAVVAAPDVLPNVHVFFRFVFYYSFHSMIGYLQEQLDSLRHVDPTSKELLYNPKAEELFAPTLGPDCPFKSGQQRAHRNTLAGFVEPAHLSEFQFEAQRKTFTSFGIKH